MIEEIRKIDSGRSQLRKFGITVGAVFAVLGVVFLLRGKNHYPYFIGPGLGLIFFGGIWPRALAVIYKIWMSLALVMGWVMSRLILSVLFYIVLTPIGLFLKLIGKDVLNQRLNRSSGSYWIDRKEVEPVKGSYENRY